MRLAESEKRTGLWAWKHTHTADGTVTYEKLEGDVQFEDVTFSYDGKKTVLNGISLYAKPGQKIAFVGSTGAGKTTITNLLNRFYEIQAGKSATTASTSTKSKKRICAVPWQWYSKIRTCLRARWRTIFATAIWTPRMNRL